jgi:hypothetical protein
MYPHGLKPGDFIQGTQHFGDIFFEVISCYCDEEVRYWQINYVTFDKYGSKPRENWINNASTIRRVLTAEMAVPVMLYKRLRFHSTAGQYDPLYGFAPAGTPLRQR